MHNALRSFIREALLSADGADKSTSSEELVDAYKQNLLKYSLNDKRFSLTKDGEPKFTVIADNQAQSQVVIIPYPQERQVFDDQGNNYTQEDLINALGAEKIPIKSPVIQAILSDTDGWLTSDARKSQIKDDFLRGKALDAKVFPNLLIMDRDPDLLKRPRSESTRSAIEASKKFECKLSAQKVVEHIFDMQDLTLLRSPEWREYAACYYEYASGIEGAALSGLVMGTLALMATSETGPFSFGAFIGAAGTGAASHDIVMRIPVIAWSLANGKTKFAAANIVYIAIVLIFESLFHYKEAKAILKAGEVVGVKNAASTSSNIIAKSNIAKSIVAKFEKSGMTRLAKDELGKIIDGIFSHTYDAKDIKVSEQFFKNAVTAAERLDFWTPTKLCIVGFALQLATYFLGSEAVDQCRSDIEALANGDFNIDFVEMSKSELFDDPEAGLNLKYPPM